MEGERSCCEPEQLGSLSTRPYLCREQEGELALLLPAVSTPGFACWERGALPALPSACLASHGLRGMAGPAHSLPGSLQPPPASEGGSRPPTHCLAFPKGCCSFPAARWSFGEQLSCAQAVLAARRCQRRGSARCTQRL